MKRLRFQDLHFEELWVLYGIYSAYLLSIKFVYADFQNEGGNGGGGVPISVQNFIENENKHFFSPKNYKEHFVILWFNLTFVTMFLRISGDL